MRKGNTPRPSRPDPIGQPFRPGCRGELPWRSPCTLGSAVRPTVPSAITSYRHQDVPEAFFIACRKRLDEFLYQLHQDLVIETRLLAPQLMARFSTVNALLAMSSSS